ncbi:MAG: hypothetical protein E7473_00010 [Ruminococcaceae bacterium]|nr:hypothetical protein [Oscillospiraceae bacterium]
MKKVLSLILAITMIAAFIPTAFAADGDATTVTYTFTQAGKGANTDWLEKINKTNDGTIATAFTNQTFSSAYETTESTDPNRRWAYLGTSVKNAAYQAKKSSDQPVMLYTGTKYFMRTYATEQYDWVALKIKVPADGKYKLTSATAFCQSSASSDIGVYILPMDLTVTTADSFNGKPLSEVFARGSSIYGNFTIDASTGYSVRNDAKKFTELGISAENQAKYKAASLNVQGKNIGSSAAVSAPAVVSENSQGIELEGDTEYILLLCNMVGGKTINIESLTLTAEAESESEETTPVELKDPIAFGAGADILVNGEEYKTGNIKSFTPGTSVTVEVTDTENFAGWVRGTANSGVWVSSSPSYEFKIMSPTYLTPVWTSAPAEGSQKVEFWNENGAYIDSSDVADGMAAAPTAEDVKLAGYTFNGWWTDADTQLALTEGSVNVSALSGAIIRAVAKHNAQNGFGTPISDTNANATYWKRGDVIVAYGADYTFYKWNDTPEITFGTDQVEENPLVVLEATSVDGAYMIEYDKGNASEIVEAGIIFGSTADIHIGSTDGSKAASQRNGDENGHGQFCAKPNKNGAHAYARGYLIYRGTDEKLYVIYTAAVATTSAQ